MLVAVSCVCAMLALSAHAAHGDADVWQLDVEGQIRERYESSRHPLFGLSTPPSNDYLLHRATLLADFHAEDRVRVLAEVVGGFASGWNGTPPATQDDALDLLQGYVEGRLPLADGDLATRLGRQEISLGSARLVSVREAPNIRRSFDGLRLTWSSDEVVVDAFFVRPVLPETGVFDDRSSARQRFWGLYATSVAPLLAGLRLDAYYLGLRRDAAVFSQGVGREIRHSIGTRLYGERDAWDWNFEGVWQWGSFGPSRIRAWTASSDAGYTFASIPFKPRIGLKTDVISGDDDLADRTLGTFNPMFPRLPYFSEANLATPANLLDVQPSLALSLTPQLSVSLSWNALWKHAKADAFYSPPLSAVEGTQMTQGRAIGRQWSSLIEWRLSQHLTLATTYVSFAPEAVTRDAGGRRGSFFAAWAQFTF